MKQQVFIILLSLWLTFNVSAQTNGARLIDEFPIIPCGEFMARMDGIMTEAENSPDSKIYVVYYGRRFKRVSLWNKKTRKHDQVRLEYPHREDGLNWAKSIPFYLTSEFIYKTRALPKDKIALVNGGFRENIGVEVWLVSKDVEPPEPNSDINEKNIKFRNDKPLETPNFTTCYSGY